MLNAMWEMLDVWMLAKWMIFWIVVWGGIRYFKLKLRQPFS